MSNFRIVTKGDNYIIVIADSKRFGKNEVVFEGNTFEQCFDYVKRMLRRERLSLTACLVDGSYTDREGRCFPCRMEVIA